LNKPLLFDKKVQVSDLGKDFVTQCLQRQLDKRPYSHELLLHPWFNLEDKMRYTHIREDIIGSSFEDKKEREGLTCCKVMLYEVIE
jgi:serine/threonine protein kinase